MLWYTTSAMADQVGKYNVNNILLSQNAFNINDIKEEHNWDDFADEKIHISETTITVGNAIIMDKDKLRDHSVYDKIKGYNVSTALDNIKTESSSKVEYDMIPDDFKIEEDTSTDNIKIEFNNGLMYCEDCHVYCEEYCGACGMLVHILNNTLPINADNISRAELPSNILEIRHYSGESRIFALKIIPAGVKFGPFTGLSRTERHWKIKGGKFAVSEDKSKYLNWMQYINPAKNISEGNLLVFQYEHNLYYQSTRQIQEGDELLVYFGEEYDDSLNRNVEMDFIPTVELNFKDAYACTYCCLGFSSKSYLAKHKNICPGNEDGGFSIEELVQCPSCKIHLAQTEYIEHHMAYCCERNGRKYDQTLDVNRRGTQARLIYKCQHCKYGTRYKADLKNHTNQHYEVKTYKCGTCQRRFKTKEGHMECTHICDGRKGDSEHSSGAYAEAYVKTERSGAQDDTKQFKCSMCNARTKYKSSLKRHVQIKHLKESKYKCETCDYTTSIMTNFRRHTETKHLKEFKHTCDMCDYRANQKSNLKTHIETRHLNEFKYKCDKCDYKTNKKFILKKHIESKHLKEFMYKCDACEYKANEKHHLKEHIETRHLKEFKYKCDACDYKTNLKCSLKRHVEAKHSKEFKYKCETCDYKSNLVANLRRHIETRHLQEFQYKCDTCDYKANSKSVLKTHTETKHLKEFKYTCGTCDYKTNNKFTLKTHIESKHLKEFKYKCDTCDYKTNSKSTLKTHIESKHLKEFKYKCDRCDYKTNKRSTLKTHIESKHLRAFKYKCDTCDYKTNWQSDLKRHIETQHLKEFKCKCDRCDYRTNKKSALKKHIDLRHLNLFKYKCDKCNYKTNSKSNLKTHTVCLE